MGLPKLTRNRIQDKLQEQNREIKCLDEPDGYRGKIRWRCSKHHEWVSSPHVVLTQKRGCPRCSNISNESVDESITQSNIKIQRLESVKTSNTPIQWKCLCCDFIWKARPSKILRKDTTCPKCSNRQRITNELVDERMADRNISRVGNVKTIHDKTEWRCNLGHVWNASPSSVINHQTGCPFCYANVGGHGSPVNYDGLYFRSQLEKEAYVKLKEYTITRGYTIIHQKRYNDKTKHTCDFYIPEIQTWIEISNYSSSNYIKTIKQKERWVKNMGETFFFTDDVDKVCLP